MLGNPEGGEYPSLEAVTRGLVKTEWSEDTYCVSYFNIICS
jgi:hypothetical protein